jgi:hypothetical protein
MADGRRGSRFLWNIERRLPNKVSYHKMVIFIYAEDWGSRYPRNVGTYLPEYMELQLHTTANVGGSTD